MEGSNLQRVILAAIVVLIAAVPARAGQAPELVSYAPDKAPGDVIPNTVVSYGSSAEVTEKLASRVLHSAPAGEPAVLRRTTTPALQSVPETGRKRKYLPILLSALVPGAGEMYLGHWKRGIALVAVEAGAWSGYVYKHNQGLDSREEYEDFADTYWNQQRFIDNHYLVYPSTGFTLEDLEELGQAGSGSGVWPGYNPWVSRADDKQHYYENIGKYDWYVSGWDDYVPGTHIDDIGPGEVLSERRETYRDMRGKSNDQLDAADRFIYLSIAARVFSLIETTLMVTRSSDDDMARTDNHWRVGARSEGPSASSISLEYWFK